ncbi:hypothetical protein BJ508DRAFT_43963 [Ascobolus immersus RN42]|uniref:Uncharacterized protein n=1 Tax=Ascobolus immersus RN42 TaxID=1160509 RepID=A0A3N4HQD3_ASCIM|nr:hypothetical protein BJ508DRAFT_43963 [Ascobolus immersus RN42]
MMSPRPTPPSTPLTPRHRHNRSLSSRFPSIFTAPKSPGHQTTASASSISTIASVSSTSSSDVNASLLPDRSWRRRPSEVEEEKFWSKRRWAWWRSRRGVLVMAAWVGAVLVVGWFGLEVSRGDDGRLKGWKEVFSTSSTIAAAVEVGVKAVDVTATQLSAVVVTRTDGSMGWTFQLPELSEMLKAEQYAEMCKSAASMPAALHAHTGEPAHAGHNHREYYFSDPTFIDPDNRTTVSDEETEICASTLTYQLNEKDVAMGKSLLGLYLAYGLAQRERRAFFIDSTTWAYGSYADYFTPPPPPPCRPPPRDWILPCPRTARHLVMTSTTAGHNLGHAFVEEYEDPKAQDTARQVRIFALARAGYEDLFRPSTSILKVAQKRVGRLDVGWKGKEGQVAVVQVRRGEVHPYRFKERFGYIPVEEYFEVARNRTGGEKVVVMSDAPEAVEGLGAEVSGEGTGLGAPRLAAPGHGVGEGEVERMFVNGVGFYKGMFEGLDVAGREAWGKSFVFDLAVAAMVLDSGSKASDGAVVVCGLKSYMCRLLAVVLGWDKAVVEKRWRNVDGMWGWRGWEW